MTQFTKTNLTKFGDTVSYFDGEKSHFVARSKYKSGSLGGMITFLIKNFTAEEYLGRLVAGEYPLPIMESKGYIQPHIKKWLKEAGLPVTREGYQTFVSQRTTTHVKAK